MLHLKTARILSPLTPWRRRSWDAVQRPEGDVVRHPSHSPRTASGLRGLLFPWQVPEKVVSVLNRS